MRVCGLAGSKPWNTEMNQIKTNESAYRTVYLAVDKDRYEAVYLNQSVYWAVYRAEDRTVSESVSRYVYYPVYYPVDDAVNRSVSGAVQAICGSMT